MSRFYFLFLLSFFSIQSFSQTKELSVDSLLNLIRTSSSDTAKISWYEKLAMIPRKDTKVSLGYAQSALALSTKNADANIQGYALKTKADIFSRSFQNDSALSYYSDALIIFTRENNYYGKAVTEYGIGNTLNDADRLTEAMTSYMECEKDAERAHSPKNIAYAKIGIGTINLQTKNDKDAERWFREALEMSLKANDNKLLGWNYTCLGEIQLHTQNYEKALEFFKNELASYTQADYIRGIAGAYNNIGVSYSYMNNYDEAIVNYQHAADIQEKVGNNMGQETALQNIAELYNREKNFSKGLEFAKKASSCGILSNSLSGMANSYNVISEAYAGLKTYDSAYKYFVLFKKFNDSIYNQTTQDKLTQMQAQYDNTKQQQQISLLQKDNKIGLLYNYIFAIVGCLVLILSLFVYNRYRIKNKANKLLAEQNHQITIQKKEITDSINYAKRIQQSILPSLSSIRNFFPQSFILYRPKDIVSGDFYWMEKVGKNILLASVDCTGHGVPGAMMSVLGYNLLTEAVVERKLSKPSDILASLNSGIIRALQRQSEEQVVKDGMDIALCSYDPDTMKLEYSGVYNPLYLVRNGNLKIFDANREALGLSEENISFNNHVIDVRKNDCVYIFTDGYADQFGGPAGKKFKYKQLQEVLVENASLEMEAQKQKLEAALDKWKGNLEQVDDILLIGFRI